MTTQRGMFDDLEDADEFAVTRPAPGPEQARTSVAAGITLGTGRNNIENRNQVAQFKCTHCRGSGRFVRGFYNPRDYGPCNRCKGTGFTKTDPMVLQQQKQNRLHAKQLRTKQYREEHKAEFEWCAQRANRLAFAASMLEALNKYQSWTDNQLAAIRRCIAKDQERTARPPDAEVAGPGFTRILGAFVSARASGLKYPKFTVGDYRFSPATSSSRYPAGTIFIKRVDDGTYCGRIEQGGQFYESRSCGPVGVAQIREICADPLRAAQLHGKQTGRCSCCGRELENAESVALGIGPICRGKWGI